MKIKAVTMKSYIEQESWGEKPNPDQIMRSVALHQGRITKTAQNLQQSKATFVETRSNILHRLLPGNLAAN